ncbi:hypothetical protein ACFL43_05870 [Thermodesulfobacteriota bacterium]
MKSGLIQKTFLGGLLFLMATTSTVKAADIQRPVGWSEDSHGNDAAPNYTVVLPQGKVNRIDLTFAPSDWLTMLGNLRKLLGRFGRGYPAIPPAMYIPCEGRDNGDTCVYTFALPSGATHPLRNPGSKAA